MTARNRIGLVLLATAAICLAPSLINAAERAVLGEYFTNQY